MMEGQPQPSTSYAMSTSQRLFSDVQRLNLESEGSISNSAHLNTAGKLRF